MHTENVRQTVEAVKAYGFVADVSRGDLIQAISEQDSELTESHMFFVPCTSDNVTFRYGHGYGHEKDDYMAITPLWREDHNTFTGAVRKVWGPAIRKELAEPFCQMLNNMPTIILANGKSRKA